MNVIAPPLNFIVAPVSTPIELRQAIESAKAETRGGELVVVFQPLGYARMRTDWLAFAAALAGADRVIITDIDPNGEEPIPGVSAWRIAERAEVPCDYIPQVRLVADHVRRKVAPGSTVLVAGRGSVQTVPPTVRAAWATEGSKYLWVAYAGDSAEREVSIHSGRSMAAALTRKGYDVDLVDLSDILLSAVPQFPSRRPDAVVLAVHGTNAEDGAIQGLLELMHLPYTGSGIQASALAMDKNLTKQILIANGLPVAKGWLMSDAMSESEVTGSAWVVKPNAQGSTVGLTFVEDREQLSDAIRNASGYGSAALVEEWVRGVEISVPVLGDRALPAVEIVPVSGHYDFANKYEPGATDEICPARLTEAQTALVADYALRAHRALGCSGATRTDMIVAKDQIVILEVNTLPGMTATSLLPKAAETAGIGYDDLCHWLVEDAVRRNAQR